MVCRNEKPIKITANGNERWNPAMEWKVIRFSQKYLLLLPKRPGSVHRPPSTGEAAAVECIVCQRSGPSSGRRKWASLLRPHVLCIQVVVGLYTKNKSEFGHLGCRRNVPLRIGSVGACFFPEGETFFLKGSS